MNRSDREIKNFKELEAVIDQCQTIRIGIQDRPFPYVVPLSFGYEVNSEGKPVFYIHGSKKGKKAALLEKDPNVCVEGDCFRQYLGEGSGTTCLYESFIATGRARLLLEREARHGLELILKHCRRNGCFDQGVEKGTAVYGIQVEEITGKRNL